MTRAKKIGIFFGLLVFAAAGAVFFMREEGAQEVAPQTAVVEKASIEEIVSAQGTLEPKEYVDVGVQVSGQILKLHVDIGDSVKKDQILAEIDPSVYQASIDSSHAEIKVLDAQVRQQTAQADYDALQLERARKLMEANAVSRNDFEDKERALKVTQAAIDALQAQKEKAQALLKTATINLGYTKIYAPMDGIVSDRKANEGQTLNANQTTPTILQVANLGVMTVRAEIAEADVMRLRPGMASTFTTLGEKDRIWKGVIRQILPTPTVVNDVVLYNVLIDVDNADGTLMNGMSVQNSFVVARAENALVIPARALGERLAAQDTVEGKAYRIQVMEQGQPRSGVVHVGLVTRTKAEVRSGVKEGDSVVTFSGAPNTSGPNAKTGPRMLGPRL